MTNSLRAFPRRPCHGGPWGIGGGRPRCAPGGVPKDGCGGEPDSWLRPTATTNALGETSARTLSPAGRVLAETSAHGGQYRYGWDAAGRMSMAAEQGGGQVRAAYNPDGSVATVTNRLGETTSYRYDSRTGLYNYGYRDYNPQTVRFTTVDPILKLPTTLGLKERS